MSKHLDKPIFYIYITHQVSRHKKLLHPLSTMSFFTNIESMKVQDVEKMVKDDVKMQQLEKLYISMYA